MEFASIATEVQGTPRALLYTRTRPGPEGTNRYNSKARSSPPKVGPIPEHRVETTQVTLWAGTGA